ncbi:hypothetical protein [Gemmatimonas sp. UBA7669]|uniref:hypothetical protein n=1 Tax=Gemmatimonas sp. UBA7669 TaxID=1946568 RepID=UPI0025BCDC14|nr:hypothetical protein [Gemmatimonas sp. UBA7669]
MTDFDAEGADLRARWDAAAQSDSLRPTADEEAAMRQHVLAAIAVVKPDNTRAPERRLSPNQHDQGQHQQQSRRRWAFAASLAAAAVLVVSVVLRDAPRDAPRDSSGHSVAAVSSGSSVASESTPVPAPDDAMRDALEAAGSAPMRTALQLASREASPEFAALDAAANELDAELARHPEDAELRAFRATLDARREELTQRIRSVTE